MVRPHRDRQECDRDAGGDDHPVAEDRLAGEHRDDLRNDAEGRQRHDVDLGVAEVPEQVLPQDRITAAADVEEMRPKVAVDEQHGLSRRQRWDSREYQPGEDRQAEPAHSRRAQRDSGHQQIDASCDGSSAGYQQTECPVVDAALETERLLAQRRVAEPTGVGRRAIQKGEVQNQSAKQEQPVAEGVQARKRHVTCTDLEWHDVVGKSQQDRHDHQEDHGGAVHREHRVVCRRVEECVARHRQLDTDEQRLESTDQHERGAGGEVQDADVLVIDRGEPPQRTRRPQLFGGWSGYRRRRDRHFKLSR